MKKIIYAIIIANLLGVAYGFYYYAPQLASTPNWLWLFVADSPISVALAAAFFTLALLGKKNNLVTQLAVIANIKYGAWTVFVLLYYADYFFSPTNALLYAIMFATHAAMVVQGAFIASFASASRVTTATALALAWFLTNDVFDYLLFNTHTRVPETPEKLAVTALVALALTLAATLASVKYRGKIIPRLQEFIEKQARNKNLAE